MTQCASIVFERKRLVYSGVFFCGAHGVNPRVVPIMKEDGVDISARLVEMIA